MSLPLELKSVLSARQEQASRSLEQFHERKQILDVTEATGDVFSVADYKDLKRSLLTFTSITAVAVGNCAFEDAAFSKLVNLIKNNPTIMEIKVSTAKMPEGQLKLLKDLVALNERKGLRVTDYNGAKLAYQLDPSGYIESKSGDIDYIAKIRETTKKALALYEERYGEKPRIVIDFGAGTGNCTIPLILQGCPRIIAVDGDEESLAILDARLADEIEKMLHTCPEAVFGKVERVVSPFITAELPASDMEISSFTDPYRSAEAFPAMWAKKVACVREGGLFAGHLFTRPLLPDDATMTYHSIEEARALIEKDFDILWLHEQTFGFEIWNGDDNGGMVLDDDPAKRPWGNLIHYVAIKRPAVESTATA